MLGAFRALLRGLKSASGKLTAELDALEGMVARDIPLLQHYGFSSRPLEGADVVVIELGRSTQRVIVADGDKRYSISLEPGEVALHTAEASIKLSPDGTIRVVGSSVQVESSDITLGSGLKEALVQAGFLTAFNEHTHLLGILPTTPPVVPVEGYTTSHVKGS